nr:hypothetical protein 38 [bacterium]
MKSQKILPPACQVEIADVSEVLDRTLDMLESTANLMVENIENGILEENRFMVLPYIKHVVEAYRHKVEKTKAVLKGGSTYEEDYRVTGRHIWTNIWVNRDSNVYVNGPFIEESFRSYDDAMESIEYRSRIFNIGGQTYDYLCTYFHQIDRRGRTTKFEILEDLPDDVENWRKECEAEWEGYVDARTLYGYQLVDRRA